MPTLKISATLTDVDGNPLNGKVIHFYKSIDGINFSLLATKVTDSNGKAEITDDIANPGTYYYKAEFPGDTDYLPSEVVTIYEYTEEAPSDWMQMFMQWLPWILMIMFIVLMVSLLTAALR